MQTVMKYYKHNGNRQKGYVEAVIDWTPLFLQYIYNRFGIGGVFTVKDVEDLFRNYCSITASRLKFYRLYKNNWFVRRKDSELGIYLYSFSNAGVDYSKTWGGFNYEGPLLWSKKPKIIEKKIEVRRQIINRDRYLCEV